STKRRSCSTTWAPAFSSGSATAGTMPGVQLQRAGHPTWAFSQRSGQRLLHPEHVPVPAELPAHLAENANLAEPEVAVQRDGGVIGQRGAGVCAMHIHTLESIE